LARGAGDDRDRVAAARWGARARDGVLARAMATGIVEMRQ
jgi:hypothetical protein